QTMRSGRFHGETRRLPMLYAIVGVVSLAAGVVGLVLLALRGEYLLVLRGPRGERFVLERAGARRYRVIDPAELPLAVTRGARHLVATGLPALARRALARSRERLPAPMGSKA